MDLMKETTEKEWNVKRMKPEKRKASCDNTLAFDLSKEPPKIERAQKRRIYPPDKNKSERKGRKIFPQKNQENPRNTLAFK